MGKYWQHIPTGNGLISLICQNIKQQTDILKLNIKLNHNNRWMDSPLENGQRIWKSVNHKETNKYMKICLISIIIRDIKI